MRGDNYDHEHIADPIHGRIGVSELELNIINTPAFQRLRNIHQLGFAHFVFPSADYSRFVHSIGVCHLAGRVMNNWLRKQDKCRGHKQHIRESEWDGLIKKYRLAALLHDIGHYPYSHAIEEANKAYSGGAEEINPLKAPPLPHEANGAKIIESDPEISKVLENAEIRPAEIGDIFSAKRGKFSNLISSDLDVDRIDYLSRNAHSSGVPYGIVDREYLVGHIGFQEVSDNPDLPWRLYIDESAMRTAEHTLLSRYFDYQQMIFHTDVVGFEKLLVDVLLYLMTNNEFPSTEREYAKFVKSGEWSERDDPWLLSIIRKKWPGSEETSNNLEGRKARMLLRRKAPELVFQDERLFYISRDGNLIDRNQNDMQWRDRFKNIEGCLVACESKLGLEGGTLMIFKKEEVNSYN